MKIDCILSEIGNGVTAGNLDNEDLVQIIELAGSYLNIATISDYAKQNNISYNGAKKYRTIKKIFNTKFVIDNE